MNPHWRPWKVLPGLTFVRDSQKFFILIFAQNVSPVAKYKIAIKNNLFYFATLIFLGYNTSICSNCELSFHYYLKSTFVIPKKIISELPQAYFFKTKIRTKSLI